MNEETRGQAPGSQSGSAAKQTYRQGQSTTGSDGISWTCDACGELVADDDAQLLDWTLHLQAKQWFEATDWTRFIYGRVTGVAWAS